MTKFALEDRPDNRAVIVQNGIACAEVWPGGYAACAEMVRLANNASDLLVALDRLKRALVESCGIFRYAEYEHLVLGAINKAMGVGDDTP